MSDGRQRAHGQGRAAGGPRRRDVEAGRTRRGRGAARQRDRAQLRRPDGRAWRAGRLCPLPRSGQRQAAAGVRPAQRAGDGGALHAGRPLAGDGERGRRRRSCGTSARARRPRRCGGTQTGSRRCRSPQTAGRSTPPGVDGTVFIWDLAGTRRLGRPIDAGEPNGARAALSDDGRRLALGHANGTMTVVDLSRPGARRTFTVVPNGDGVSGIRLRAGQPARDRPGSGRAHRARRHRQRAHRAHDRAPARRRQGRAPRHARL